MAGSADPLDAGFAVQADDIAWLRRGVPAFAGTATGAVTLHRRPPGFTGLIRIITAQRVSTQAAQAAWRRLTERCGPEPDPGAVLDLPEDDLAGLGLGRQRAGYLRAVAEAVRSGALDLDALARQDDATVRRALTGIRGIGPWTADVYLLMALGRRDIFPLGDLALVIAIADLLGLEQRPTGPELRDLVATWAPRRSAAAQLLWFGYLQRRGLPVPA